MADPQTIQQPQPETTVVPEVDYKKQFEEINGKYKELEGKYTEEIETAKNMDAYFTQDEVAKQRAALWLQSQKEGKPFQELLKTLETSPAKPIENQTVPTFDEKKMDQLMEKKLQSYLEPVYSRNADLDQERSKAELFKAEPWLTDEKYKVYETRYGKKIDEIAGAEFQTKGPFITQQERQSAAKEAYKFAHSKFAHLSESELVRIFMADERDSFIAAGRRTAPKLPDGMVDNLPTGKAPELLKQLKQEYGQTEGDHQAVAKLCAKYAPLLGMDEMAVHKLLV